MKEIQCIDGYSYDEIVDLINDFVIDKIWDNGYSADDIQINDIQLHGSRLRGQARSDSDLDAVVEYSGNIHEDDLFNMLHEDPLYIDDVEVDINPINSDETSMSDYMQKSKEYDKLKLSESIGVNKMIKQHKLTLEERVARLERKLKPVNEVGPLLAKVLPLITKYLPLILNALPALIDAISNDQLNDEKVNAEKAETLKKFAEVGQEVVKMFSGENK